MLTYTNLYRSPSLSYTTIAEVAAHVIDESALNYKFRISKQQNHFLCKSGARYAWITLGGNGRRIGFAHSVTENIYMDYWHDCSLRARWNTRASILCEEIFLRLVHHSLWKLAQKCFSYFVYFLCQDFMDRKNGSVFAECFWNTDESSFEINEKDAALRVLCHSLRLGRWRKLLIRKQSSVYEKRTEVDVVRICKILSNNKM